MRKTTIAIIMLLSVTAVFGQTKHYSAVQTNFGPEVRLYSINDPDDMRAFDVIMGYTQKKKPLVKKQDTKPATRKTKINKAGHVYIGAYPGPYEYDFTSPVQYHGYTDVSLFPAKTKCDTIKIRDTIRIRDTVPMPVYLVDVTDTIPATVLYKKSEKSDRIYTVKGFALVRGFKVMAQGKPQWADKPQIVGALDDKKRPIKNVIQVL